MARAKRGKRRDHVEKKKDFEECGANGFTLRFFSSSPVCPDRPSKRQTRHGRRRGTLLTVARGRPKGRRRAGQAWARPPPRPRPVSRGRHLFRFPARRALCRPAHRTPSIGTICRRVMGAAKVWAVRVGRPHAPHNAPFDRARARSFFYSTRLTHVFTLSTPLFFHSRSSAKSTKWSASSARKRRRRRPRSGCRPKR